MSSKSFTTAREVIDFDVDGEMFFLRADIAAGEMFELSALQAKLTAATGDLDTNAGIILMEEFKKILDDDSHQRFAARFFGKDPVTGDRVKMPITPQTFEKILEWIFGAALGKESSQQ